MESLESQEEIQPNLPTLERECCLAMEQGIKKGPFNSDRGSKETRSFDHAVKESHIPVESALLRGLIYENLLFSRKSIFDQIIWDMASTGNKKREEWARTMPENAYFEGI